MNDGRGEGLGLVSVYTVDFSKMDVPVDLGEIGSLRNLVVSLHLEVRFVTLTTAGAT